MTFFIRRSGPISLGILLLALASSASSLTGAAGPVATSTPAVGKNSVTIRGRQQEIYYYPATGAKLNRKVLFTPGDGGWRGWAITVAQQMASWGYDVYGLDTKTYLESVSGGEQFRESEVISDFRQIAQWAARNAGERVTLVGWSEGAGLSVLAASNGENKQLFNGLVTFGLGNENVLGWSWKDDLSYLTRAKPNEPRFYASGLMAKIAPLPYLMIQSSQDEYVPFNEAQSLAIAAGEPKRVAIIPAHNHRFDGQVDEFYRTLREGLQWIK